MTLAVAAALAGPGALSAATITNPIIGSGADPWVTQWQGQYFYVRSAGGAIHVDRATRLQDIGTVPAANRQVIWQPPPGTAYSHNLWAPELHYLDNKWYLYVAADDGNNANHRMYVLEGTSQDPQGTYVFKGKIAASTDRWAIDGTVLTHNNTNYFVWSGWPGTTDGQQNLYVAQMSNPWTISGNRALIASPTYDWEKHGLSLNEGPQVLQKDGTTSIIYSASGFWRQEYALGQLKLTGSNPMSASSWTKSPTPVFSASADVKGVGHASFTHSPDGGHDWIVYHAHDNPVSFSGNRDVRTQRFTHHADGTPNFGSPVSSGVPIPAPSGRAVVTFIPNSSFERIDVTSSGSGQGLNVQSLKTSGLVGVSANDGRFFNVIGGGEGPQVGFIGSSGINEVSHEVGQVVKAGTYEFSAGFALSSNQLGSAASSPTSYQVRLESVGLKPDGTANEADKVVLGTTTVDSASLNASNFTYVTTKADFPLLHDRYDTLLRFSIASSGAGGGSWSAKLENLKMNFAPLARPQTPATAYWRFEAGPAGGSLTGTGGNNAQPHTVANDSAGGNDNLRAYDNAFSPRYSTDVAAGVVPATGEANNYSFDFSPDQHLYTKLPGDLEARRFDAFTIEASFKLDTLNRWQVVVGKDGRPTPNPIAPLQLKARDDNDRIQIEILDATGAERQVSSVDVLQTGQWYHVAAVNTGAELALYLDRNDGLGYVLQGTTAIDGALIDSVGTWTVGRGMYNGLPADFLDGKIDEVRVTDSAIDPTQFLFYDPAGPPVWSVNAGGSWSSQANWSRALPNSINARAYFTDAIRSSQTITVDAPQTVAGLVFNNVNRYVLAGESPITIDTNGAAGAIQVLRGSHTISAPLQLNRSTTISVPFGSTLTLSGDLSGTQDAGVTKSGSGQLELKHVRAASFNVFGGNVRSLPNGTTDGTSVVGSLTIAAGSSWDLRDNDLIVTAGNLGSWNGTAYTGITGLIASGRNDGAWDGTGLITRMPDALAGELTTLGVASAAQALAIDSASTAEWSGQFVRGGDVLVSYTYGGDANLDGLINIDDYGQIDFNVAFSGSVFGYFNGDFNYDGLINIDDYGIIDFNVGIQGPPLAALPAFSTAPMSAVMAIPEPGVICTVILPLRCLARRPKVKRLTVSNH